MVPTSHLQPSPGMFIALTRPRQVVQFYYYFIITGQTLQPDNYSELLAPSTKSSPQPQECSLIFSRNENIFHFGSCRYYHGVRKDKITRYNQFLMTWYDPIYILSWKEMTIANKMVQGNGIRKIDCQLSFPLLVSQSERDVGNDMLSVAMIYICCSN